MKKHVLLLLVLLFSTSIYAQLTSSMNFGEAGTDQHCSKLLIMGDFIYQYNNYITSNGFNNSIVRKLTENLELIDSIIISNENSKVAEDARVAQLIINFNNKIKESSFKNGETMSMDSAIWYIEANINYFYCFADTNVQNIVIDTTFVEITSAGEFIPLSEIQQSVETIETAVMSMYYEMNDPNTVVLLSDVSLLEVNKSDSHTLQVLTIYGIEAPSSNPGNDCYGGYVFNSPIHFIDAAAIFQNYINNPLCPQPHYDYITNVKFRNVCSWDQEYDYLNPDDDIPEDNYYDYQFFYQREWWPNDHETMSIAELNFYFQQIYQVLIPTKLADIENQYPAGRSFISCIVTPHQTNSPVNNTEWEHSYSFTFGNKRLRIEDPGNPITL